MEKVRDVVQIITIAISCIGAFIVMWGVIKATIEFISLKFFKPREPLTAIESIRHHLGAHLLLGLEVFIGADIISSVVSPTWEKVGILAAIVGVRVVLSYFLRMELRQSQ